MAPHHPWREHYADADKIPETASSTKREGGSSAKNFRNLQNYYSLPRSVILYTLTREQMENLRKTQSKVGQSILKIKLKDRIKNEKKKEIIQAKKLTFE